MPGTLNGFGMFDGEKRLDAEPKDKFEKVVIHAYIEDGIKECVIYKQVGNKKYFVKEVEDETEHSVYKLLKNKLIAWVDEEEDDDLDVYTFNYDIYTNDDGELVAAFKPASEEGVEVKIETLPASDNEEPVVEEPAEPVVQEPNEPAEPETPAPSEPSEPEVQP